MSCNGSNGINELSVLERLVLILVYPFISVSINPSYSIIFHGSPHVISESHHIFVNGAMS